MSNEFTNEQAAQFAQRHFARLSQRESDFIRDVLRQRWRGPSLSLTAKQSAWVQRIAARIRGDLEDENVGPLVEVEEGATW